MHLAFQSLRHGWLRISLSIASRRFDIAASSVLNDPISELLSVALWLAAPDEPLPHVRYGCNKPHVEENLRCVHFWPEPAWHTLLIQRLNHCDDVALRFYQNHEGSLIIGPDDFRSSERTWFDECSGTTLAHSIHACLADIRDSMNAETYIPRWQHPFAEDEFQRLSMLLPGVV